MSSRTLVRSRGELSEFLLRHRTRLVPADVGLATTGHRRTPGLRREEVAALAGVGLTWYTWFEQGREIQVSESFLLKVAKALKLDDTECSHLFLLAHRRPPPPEAYQWPSISALTQQLLDDLITRPAYVVNLRWDVIAWNEAADSLFGFSSREAAERNVMRLVFADPQLRRRLPAWQEDAPKLLAQFRSDLATAPDDPAMLGLIDDLKKLSPDFRRWFEQPGRDSYSRGIGAILDLNGARLNFAHETLIADEHRHLRMIIYFLH
ncbi:transcriptional regulator [Haematobacter massiliensis]|uniref:XRE family transcriptional regulator n=1 Tax=Haematobacter massiliensis TaxID=195105 RepID=A0A086YC20_9RHOB|nr:helix-turn-helix transcriptional regulator [Haematobacter massiliensis]KFI31820.1 XRE family transcriptional regulator [Haematobacter massiliensis]OWJ72422.1 transcriptional regulator [Haematobacter massiliensis]OWJ87777.1 transcriptional regulator [Haematobacter massiliensis]QBJ24214.1 XRE family transcriptional regulator [Haematobacter massiliensis]